MYFSPLHGFLEREHMGMFPVKTALASGLAVEIDNTNTAPLSGGVYGAVYGNVVAATPTQTITQSGTTPFAVTGVVNGRELGWLMQPVTTSGPSLLNVLTQVYDESVAVNSNPVVCLSKTGALIATDEYVASGTGAVKFDGTTAIATICGINAGQPRVLQAGDAPRLKFLGKVVQRNLTCAAFQIL